MSAVKLLLEEKFGEEAVFLDLFGAPLNVDDGADSSELVADTNLSTTQFNVKFEAHTKFPSVDKEDVEVSATVLLHGGKLTRFQSINVTLVIHRENKNVATVREIRALKQSVNVDWPGLTVQQCLAGLTLGEKPVQVTLWPEDGRLANFELLDVQFEFTYFLTFSADGVRGRCEATKNTLDELHKSLRDLFGQAITVTEISKVSAEVFDDVWTVHLQAAFNIPAFADGEGELKITATRRDNAKWTIESTVLLANTRRWGDPQGWFQIEKPILSLRFTEGDAGKWKVKPRLGGKITFLPTAASRLSKDIADWFGDLFEGMSTEFDSDFEAELLTITLRPFTPFKLKALEMFELRVPRIDLKWLEKEKRITFDLQGIDLRLDIGDVSLRGTIPPLSFDPFSGKLTLGAVNQLSVDLSLSAPGGVKGSARVEYVTNSTLRYLEGRGQLSTPTLPGVAVAFRVGQFRASPNEDWTPTVLLYADTKVAISLFPLVYVQQIGLAVGVKLRDSGHLASYTGRGTSARAARFAGRQRSHGVDTVQGHRPHLARAPLPRADGR